MQHTDPEHIHEKQGVRELHDGYWCRRCGQTVDNRVEMYDHLQGFPSECHWRRIRQWASRKL